MGRVVEIPYRELTSPETLHKLIYQNYILISNSDLTKQIRAPYSTIDFHVSRESLIPAIGNFAVRKSLDLDKRKRLNWL